MDQEAIRAECKQMWQEHFNNVMRECQYDPKFYKVIDDKEQVSEAEAAENLQPWLQIIEESVQWLANLTAILDRLIDENSPLELRTAWALVGASCAHTVALRRLILSGLDSTAKAVLRIVDEHLMACIVMLNRPELARDFQKAQDDNEANSFWYKNLNTKSLKKHIDKIERDAGLDSQTSQTFSDWRKQEIRVFSQSIHPSYLASALSVCTISATDMNTIEKAFLGQASAMSKRTLEYACKIIFYFSRFGFLYLFNEVNGNPAYIDLDPEDEMQQMVIIGREILLSINKKYWDYNEENPIPLFT